MDYPIQSFEIRPPLRFAGSCAAIRRPKEIAYFSFDENHEFHLDERSLRYYYTPRLDSNLSDGFESFRQLDDTMDDHLDSLLKTITALEQQTGQKCEADFITWRGMMTKIMVSVYDNLGGGSFEMNATKFQGSIFIEENHAYKLQQRKEQHMQPSFGGYSQDLMSYWGYKFETISLLPDQWDATPREFIENREKFVVNNYAQYCSVAKTAIGKAKLIIGGEVDAVWDCKPENKHDQINWVELKTSAEIYTDKDRIKYERKLLKMWIQSFLLGVPKIIVGFRSKDGILKRLEEVQTEKIPGLVKRNSGIWDGNICINFTAAFLDWLKEVITGDGVWRIRRREKSPIIEAFVQEVTGHGDILSPEFLAWRTRGSNRDPNVAKFSTETDLEELKATV